MAFSFKFQFNQLVIAGLSIGATALSACTSVSPESKLSTQSVFGNTVSGYTSVPGMTYAPKAYDCGVGVSCGVLSANECPITRQAQIIRQVECYDGTVVSDISQCGPIRLRQPVLTAAPRQYVQADTCSNGYKQETVYYEFDRSASADTQNAASRVLGYGAQCDIGSIQVVGHTDTAGSSSYNESLSQRRANDVKNALIRQGLDGTRIITTAMGERQNAVDRGDGVAEPLNRRTDIQIQTQSRGYGF